MGSNTHTSIRKPAKRPKLIRDLEYGCSKLAKWPQYYFPACVASDAVKYIQRLEKYIAQQEDLK